MRSITSVGGGSAWAEGLRKMWRAMRAKAATGGAEAGNTMLMSESQSEAYVGVLHANLALYGFTSCHNVPAFQAVYADHTVMVGALGMDILAGQMAVSTARPCSYACSQYIRTYIILCHPHTYVHTCAYVSQRHSADFLWPYGNGDRSLASSTALHTAACSRSS